MSDPIFDSNYEMAKPSQVILKMIQDAVNEGRMGITNNESHINGAPKIIWVKNEPARNLEDDINSYIERFVKERASVLEDK